ncbi:putative disease resistance protein RGA1 [Pistacia vera]|uniref:putative disease resistance protein RGA1 n=1 Tax=Pistacia vera TaxID=55513 RepID=UPI0012632F93|nr:putative disease resistance protein RGA1 [Pistacia vera]
MDPNLPGAFLYRLLNRLEDSSPEFKHLAAVSRQKGLFSKLNLWSTTLQIFMDVINKEANKRPLSDVEVKMWLELADDVEEILDEISKQASRLKMIDQSQTTMGKKSSLKGLIPACFTSSNSCAVASIGDPISTSRLEKLNTKRYAVRLRVIYSALACSFYPITVTMYEVLLAKTIYGRDEDKEKILEMVLRDEVSDHANFSVIPIIGIAGVGKTTLTRLVYDDKVVEDFKPRAWVSLYEDSNVFKISKAILESITFKSCNLKDLDEVLAQLEEAIFGRKFLFVLDDVSTENYGFWETLKSSLMAGAPGSKIIVTTHRVNFEFPVNLSIQPFILEVLSDEACWSMLKMYVSGNENYSGSRLIREKVIDMCRGLPLAASILRGLIRSMQGDERECGVLEVSFPSLSPYCDAEVDGCKMHCGEEFDFTGCFKRMRSDDVLGVNEQREEFKKTSHFDTFARSDEKNIFTLFYYVDNLRTFVPGLISNNDDHHITDGLLSDLLPKFKRLRALSLAKHNITKLPSSVEGLRYLRYVNLSSTGLLSSRRVAFQFEEIDQFMDLDISGVNLLREMPLGMKELTCLRTLLNFIVDKGVGSDLKDLEDLKFLGELYVSRLQNVTGSQDTKDSVLKDKKDLKVLVLEWDSQLDDTRDELVEENMQSLAFTWMLGLAEHLAIKGMTRIKRIGSELFGKDCSSPFKSLKTLCFEDLKEWENWDPVEENEHVEIFPCLRMWGIRGFVPKPLTVLRRRGRRM